jgi:hypothetical protein
VSPPSSFSVRGSSAGSTWAIAPPRPAPLHAVEERVEARVEAPVQAQIEAPVQRPGEAAVEPLVEAPGHERPASAPRQAVSLAGLLLTSAAPGSPEAAAAAEARLAVREALSDVPAADRLLVELRVFHGWSTAEIAQLAAGSVDEVAQRLEAILDRLGLDHAAVLPVPAPELPTVAVGEEEVVA